MSYLDTPRLTFFGQFTANPSTINNLPYNYNTSVPNPPPFWNPDGRHNFSIGPCPITGVVTDAGPSTDDPVLKATLSTSQTGVLVDLDTEQQGVSQVIGMQLTLALGSASVVGAFLPVNFMDMFVRTSPVVPGDGKFSAWYQSVLTGLTWSGDFGSPAMSALQKLSPGELSIHFIVDGYHDNAYAQGNFTQGRVAGTIGPYIPGEPTNFINARYLRATGAGGGTPVGSFNFAPAKTDSRRKKIVFDLGNAVPSTWPQGDDFPIAPTFTDPVIAQIIPLHGAPITLGTFDLSDAAYQSNAYVQEFDLTGDAATAITNSPTAIVMTGGGTDTIVMQENPSGAYVNFDQYVYRMNPGERAVVTLRANVFEKPAVNTRLPIYPNISGLQPVPGIPVGTPVTGLTFPSSVTTGADGTASFVISASDPGNPRQYIDGQLYGIGVSWILDSNPDSNCFVSVHVFDEVVVPDYPTWTRDVFPILNQYSHLYPAMQAIIALNDYGAVVAAITNILARLNAPETSPGYMPITRELSRDKLAIIEKWAANGHPQ